MPVGLKNRKKPQPATEATQASPSVTQEKQPKKKKNPNAFYAKTVTRSLTVALRESQDMEPADAMSFIAALHAELQAKIQNRDFEPPLLDSAVLAAKERVEKQR